MIEDKRGALFVAVKIDGAEQPFPIYLVDSCEDLLTAAAGRIDVLEHDGFHFDDRLAAPVASLDVAGSAVEDDPELSAIIVCAEVDAVFAEDSMDVLYKTLKASHYSSLLIRSTGTTVVR